MGSQPFRTKSEADPRGDAIMTKQTTRSSSARQGGRLSADSIGWYLSNIGRVPLLTAAEEIELAHHVQQMKPVSYTHLTLPTICSV